MTPATTPYGAWSSPLSARSLASASLRLGEVRVRHGQVHWVEGRPAEGGRSVVMARTAAGTAELGPPGFNARTRVHEYGGGAYVPVDGGVLAASMSDQRWWRLGTDGEAEPLTPEPPEPGAWRYADPALFDDDRAMVVVREVHAAGRVDNQVAVIDLADGSVEVVASGRDFYGSPRPSPNGSRIAYVAWDHPNMPWDSTELRLVDVRSGTDELVRSGTALQQPGWDPDGRLHVVDDRSGWWNLERVDDDAVIVGGEREVGVPPWVFGTQTYVWGHDGRLWCVWHAGGTAHLGVHRDGEMTEIDTGFVDFGRIEPVDGGVATVAAGASDPAAVVVIDADGHVTELRASTSEPVDAARVSRPRSIEFPTSGGRAAHALFYPPVNPDHVAPAGERPPLVVLSHGGPTAAARPAYDPDIQFWTGRGIAVVDVNYGGSTGYGTEYRNRLKGTWGVVDTEDCIAAATHLADDGLVDRDRLVIRGGSAGGYTTLCALTFHDVFRAGLSRYGIGDLAALASDTHKFEARYLDGLVGRWPDDEDVYRARSPIHHTDRLSAPMLVLQGSEDPIVPPSQAEQMTSALDAAGIPYAYVLFEGEAHGFRGADSIARSLEAELSFLGQILDFEPADDLQPVEVVGL